MDSNIKLTREDAKDHKLPYLDCAVYIEQDGSLNNEVSKKHQQSKKAFQTCGYPIWTFVKSASGVAYAV